MASRKEYEMLFALNAKMNGGFSGTFSKAQQEFSRLGKEIQGLHKVQGDIASYQKQQQAVENTRSKLESLQKQHDLLQKEISETSGSTTGLERENVKLEQRIKDTETALERQNQKFKDTEARLKEAGVDTSNLAQKDQELTARIKELEAAQDKAANSAASFGERTSAALDAVASSAITSEIINALGKLKDAFMDCVEGAGSFEEAMSTVEALSQANARDMAALSAEAKELGATTKFTAKESADAMGYMAMAGWDATDMLQGMDGVLQLAAASGEDLAMVSDIVTDSLSAFGLTAKDTAHFSDVLAAAATNSNTNVAIMGETFKMSASVAGALGYSIEDVAVAMGLMANSGVKGSIAGTALRNTFNGLLEGVTLTGAAFGEYEYSAIKADGTMKDFGSTMDELRGYFEQMTEAERVNNAMAIAGQRGYNGLLAILNATDADYASLTDSINNCTGAAQRMAAVKLDNMNGQLTLMKSAWDALKTTIGEQFIPEMRSLYKVGTDVFSGIDKFVQENPGVVKGIAAAALVIGGVTAAVTAYTAAVKIAAAATALVPGAGQIMAITAAVAGVVGVVTALATAADDSVPSMKELTEAARDMQEAMDEAGAAYEETAGKTLATAEAAGMYIDKLEELEAHQGENARESQEYQNILALLLRTVPELSGCISETTDAYGRSTYALEGSTQALRQNTEEWKKNAEAKAYQDYINSLYDQYGGVMLEAAENSIKLTQAQMQLEDIEEKRSAALERMNELDSKTADWTEEERTEYIRLHDALAGYNSEMFEAQNAVDTYTKAIEQDNESLAAAEEEINSATGAYELLTGATRDQTVAEAEAARQTQELQGAIENTMGQVAALAEAYDEAYAAALDSVSGQYDLWDKAAQVAAVSAGSINSAMESQITYWQDYNANLQMLGAHTRDIEGLSDMIASFADGSQESVNVIAGMAEAINQGDTESVKEMVSNWQALKKEQDETSQSLALLKSDLLGQMDELQTDLAADIEGMDLSEEAKAAGEATIQGYINAANEMLPQVQAAYQAIAGTAADAMGYAQHRDSAWAANRTERGYATGTENAQPGWAWVGEDGPELMFFNGGEKVLNAAQSSALQAEPVVSAIPAAPAVPAADAGGGGGSPSISLVVQVQGNATTETVDALSAKAQDIVYMVLDAIDERNEDEKRCAMR